MKLYDELVARGLIAQVTNEEEIREMIDNGKASDGISVAESLRRNRKMVSTTRMTVSAKVNCTSAIESRIEMDRSFSTEILTEGGICARKTGISALIESTTSMVLAPGWR